MVPHGRCDLPALIVGCIELRHIWKESPGREHTREATSYLFYISLDTPAGEWVVLWAVVGHSPKGEEKEGAWGSHSLMLHCRIDGALCS